MYYKFSCPLCAKKNFFTTALGQNFTRTRECRGCGKTVTWQGAQGPGVAATLADAEPGLSIGSKEDVADLVKKSAADVVLVDLYSQGERIKEFSPTDKSVQEGVCNGQSLHWIRRVLQGGRAEYKVASSKSNVQRSPQLMDAKRKAQHMGGVAAQKVTEPDELKKLSDKAYAQYTAAWEVFDAKAKSAETLFKAKMIKLGATQTADGWSYYPDDKIQAAIETRDKINDLIEAEKKKLTDQDKARQASGVYKHNWDDISKLLDAKLLEVAAAKKKRPFSGIVALKNLNRAKFADGTAGFAAKLLADPDFKLGTCALLSSGLLVGIGEAGGEISGHAVAVHFAKNNVFRIFDPNIGMFSCTSKGALKSALVAMIDQGWVKVFGWQLDKEFGYSLFESRHAVTEVTPQQTPVNYAVSAETTAIQNKAVLPAPKEAPKAAPVKPQSPVSVPKPGAVVGKAGGGNAALRNDLLEAAKTAKHLPKRAGVATADGLGYLQISQPLVKRIIAAKIVSHPDLKGESPMGDWLMKGTVNQIIEALK